MLVSPADVVAMAKATIKECSVSEAHECLDSSTLLIDIREPAEFQKGRIRGAINLPRGLLEFDIHGLVERQRAGLNESPEDQAVVLYCGTGGRSALAAQSMQAMGYRNVKSMDGGIVAWAAAGLPIDA